MKILNRFLFTIVFTCTTAFIWSVFKNYSILDLVALFFGLLIGFFILDADYILNWYLTPNNQESQLGITSLRNGQFYPVINLIRAQYLTKTNLIFHHLYFHLILICVSVFIITTGTGFLANGLVLSSNLALAYKVYFDLKNNPEFARSWYFARLSKQVPIKTFKKLNYINFLFILILAFVVIYK